MRSTQIHEVSYKPFKSVISVKPNDDNEPVAVMANGKKKLSKQHVQEWDSMLDSGTIPNYMEFIKKTHPEMVTKTDNPNFKYHQIDIPSRMILCAPSGRGKTNAILHLIHAFDGKSTDEPTFDSMQIVCANQDEPYYDFLKEHCPTIKFTEGLSSLPRLTAENFDKKKNHLIILDDIVTAKNQERIEDYYMMCRKFGVTICYCSQKFHKIPIFIRQNATLLLLFDVGDENDMKRILSGMSFGVTKESLLQMYDYCTKDQGQFLRVDITVRDIHKKFHKGFIEPIPFEIEKAQYKAKTTKAKKSSEDESD